jgi:uncharacterized protein (TIRG00374 family)
LKRNLVKLVLGLAIGVFFVWLSAKDWPLDRLVGPTHMDGSVMTVGAHGEGWSVDLLWLLPYFGILVLIHVMRVIRWKPLLDPIAPLSMAEHNRIGAVGFMAMFLFPLRLGELVRPYLVKKATTKLGTPVRMSEVLATVVVERVIDGLVVSLFLFGVLFLLPGEGASADRMKVGAFAALAVFGAAAVLLAGARWQHERTKTFVQMTAGLVSKRLAKGIGRILDDFLRGLRRLPSARTFAGFLFITLVYWALNGLGVWCMLQAFDIGIDMIGAYAMMACVVVGMMIPNSPGNVGSFWYFLCLPVGLYGISDAAPRVIAFGLAVWLMQLTQQTLFGVWFVARGVVSWKGVVAATTEDESTLVADDGGPEGRAVPVSRPLAP